MRAILWRFVKIIRCCEVEVYVFDYQMVMVILSLRPGKGEFVPGKVGVSSEESLGLCRGKSERGAGMGFCNRNSDGCRGAYMPLIRQVASVLGEAKRHSGVQTSPDPS